MKTLIALGCGLALLLPVVAGADASGAFIVRLGRDTVGVERYTRIATRLDTDQLQRGERLLHRHSSYTLTGDTVTHVAVVTTAAGVADPVQTIEASFDPDSMRGQIGSANGPPQRVATRVPHDAIVVSYDGPWAAYEMAFQRLALSRADSLRMPLHVPGARGVGWLSLHRVGRDSVDLLNIHHNQFRVRVDAAGHVLGARPLAGPANITVTRVRDVDLAAYEAAWTAQDRAGRGLGAISPRDTLRATVVGATLWIDYGRPAKRGRAIFGGVVPYGEVWRTGANAATQLRTDRPLDFGGTVVPAGFYSLWTRPGPHGWKLIVNAETGQWGTAHDAAKDRYEIDMAVSALSDSVERFTIAVEPLAAGGTLHLAWDTTRASATFRVLPSAGVRERQGPSGAHSSDEER